MNRYMIVIPAKNRSFLLKCDEGDGAKLETLQKLVSGYVETVPAALDATWAREEADRLVLLVDEEGRLKCKAANQKATNIAPADVTRNGMQPLMGAAVLALQRGDKLMGFSKHVAEDILKEWLSGGAGHAEGKSLGREAAARISDRGTRRRADGHLPEDGAADVSAGRAARSQRRAEAVAHRQERCAGAAAGGCGDLPAERQESSEKQKARRCWNTDELSSDRLKGLSPE